MDAQTQRMIDQAAKGALGQPQMAPPPPQGLTIGDLVNLTVAKILTPKQVFDVIKGSQLGQSGAFPFEWQAEAADLRALHLKYLELDEKRTELQKKIRELENNSAGNLKEGIECDAPNETPS